MTVYFFPVSIEKYLRWNSSDFKSLCLFTMLPDINKRYNRFLFINLFQFLEDRRHHFAGDAFIGSQIDHGDHALYRHATEFFRIGYDRRRNKQGDKARQQ